MKRTTPRASVTRIHAPPPVQIPSVGRIVHYYGPLTRVQDDGGPFAALVLDVGPRPTDVTLAVFDRIGTQHHRANVPYDATGRAGTWAWPARVT